jgi:hypothetical protein
LRTWHASHLRQRGVGKGAWRLFRHGLSVLLAAISARPTAPVIAAARETGVLRHDG